MQALTDQDNIVPYDVVDDTGQPITSGTVNAYLRMSVGTYANMWWDGSAWSSSETSCGAMTYVAGPLWQIEIDADAWIDGASYDFYAEESGNLNIMYSASIYTWSPPTTGAGGPVRLYTLLNSTTGDPIADAVVWITTDDDGENVVATGMTDSLGLARFYLAAGTYYIFRRKVGHVFVDPVEWVVT
jgi:hypothetical protein